MPQAENQFHGKVTCHSRNSPRKVARCRHSRASQRANVVHQSAIKLMLVCYAATESDGSVLILCINGKVIQGTLPGKEMH